MSNALPCSPAEEIDGLPYFPRLCAKVRLFADGTLRDDLHANLGTGMDLWTCQFFGVNYEDLAAVIRAGASDADALAWATTNGTPRAPHEFAWWRAFMKTRGFRDDMAPRLAQRKQEAGFQSRDDIQTFFDFIDADEGRI